MSKLATYDHFLYWNDEQISNKVKVGVEHQPDDHMLCIR